MSRTKRFYNNPKQRILFMWMHDLGFVQFWHPYKRIWTNKGCCDEPLMSKRRRVFNKVEVKREVLNLCSYHTLTGKNQCYRCLMLWYNDYGEECDYCKEVELYSFKEQYSGKWL